MSTHRKVVLTVHRTCEGRGTMRWKTAAVLGASLALAGGGCGGSKPLTKSEFASRADSACTHAHTEAIALLKTALAQQKAGTASPAQLRAGFTPKLNAVRQRQYIELEALEPPKELKSTFVQWRAAVARERRQGTRAIPPNSPEHARVLAAAKHREQLKRTLGIRAECI